MNPSHELLAGALGDVRAFVERFMYFESGSQAIAVSLWIVGTYVFDAYDTTPYLHIKSPEKRSGKSLLLELLELLCHKPLLAANVSPAALYRVVDSRSPTLLLDEVDAVFPKGRTSDQNKEDLRGLLNAGYRSSARAIRINLKASKDNQVEEFSAFCPKALAGIGDLPDTIADRCITISLQRKPPRIVVERFRRRSVESEASEVRDVLEGAISGLVDLLRQMHVQLPGEINDRQQDTWELLLAIADVAGPTWSIDALSACRELSGDSSDSADSFGQELLRDLYSVWDETETGGIPSSELCSRLVALPEARWGDYFGREFNQRDLAKVLKQYGIKSQSIKMPDGSVPRGYRRDVVWPVWERYLHELSATNATSATTQTPQGLRPELSGATSLLRPLPSSTSSTQVAHAESGASPDTATVVAQVAEVAQPTTSHDVDDFESVPDLPDPVTVEGTR